VFSLGPRHHPQTPAAGLGASPAGVCREPLRATFETRKSSGRGPRAGAGTEARWPAKRLFSFPAKARRSGRAAGAPDSGPTLLRELRNGLDTCDSSNSPHTGGRRCGAREVSPTGVTHPHAHRRCTPRHRLAAPHCGLESAPVPGSRHSVSRDPYGRRNEARSVPEASPGLRWPGPKSTAGDAAFKPLARVGAPKVQ